MTQEGEKAPEPPAGFGTAVEEAAALHGVHATLDGNTQRIKCVQEGARAPAAPCLSWHRHLTVCTRLAHPRRFLAKVTINHSAWVVSEHATAAEAARAHDAAAVGLFGREALPYLNTSPVTDLTLMEVARVIRSMAERVRAREQARSTVTHQHARVRALQCTAGVPPSLARSSPG